MEYTIEIMKLVTKVAVLLILVKLAKSAPDPCMLESEESACDQTDYEAYKECVHNELKNEVRRKRQSPCPQNNLESLVSIKENCQRANFDCRIGCGNDENCQSQCPVCPINVDELIASNNNTEEMHRTIIVENDQNVDTFRTTVDATGNITTVIRLTNIINTNSSVSDQPSVDSGIDNLTNETGGEFGLGANVNGSCCYVVHPKTCTSTSNGRRCHHRREKVCGKICTAKVVHVQARKRCNSNGCHKKISYIPQPKPPKCIHTRKWPYVACGHAYTSSCDGCYDHYDDDDDANVKDDDNDCDGCYDDGFDSGPLYRQGPVFRPYFYHVPPCYIVGSCIPYAISGGYGYFGGNYNHRRRHHEEYDDEEIDFEDVDDVDSPKPTVPPNKTETEDVADDWAIEMHKCKVVSDNGTIEIRNCTSEDIEENPYAGAPPEVDFDPEDEDYDGFDDAGFRIQRHANHHQFRHPQIVYVPVVENFDMATSDEYDFDEVPRHRRRNRQSKSSTKHHRKTNIVYDDEDDDRIDQ